MLPLLLSLAVALLLSAGQRLGSTASLQRAHST